MSMRRRSAIGIACTRPSGGLVSYRSRDGGMFAFADDLSDKRQQVREVDEVLATAARGETAGTSDAA
ncbi:hypothetical protein RHSP_82793 [Rhizobium freirei PRF 81]|uniref:Uncharacterized protein n=5 Tax=Rhizobium TaxID=379 RepID=N6V0U1_9HYPH|nr:hypothetical protein RHSP_82793 [Rhizobium freirei PRF 81]